MDSTSSSTRLGRALGASTVWLILVGVVWGIFALIGWLHGIGQGRDRAEKEDCIARGGKVIEHKGAVFSGPFTCDGPTRF